MSDIKANRHDLGILFLRVLTGLGMVYHGYGKVFGGNMDMLIQGVENMGFPMPVVFAWAAALSELLGGLFLASGFLTRWSAAMIFATMTVAAFITHASDPFQMKELAFAYWAISGAFIGIGAGTFSVDAQLQKS